MFPPLKLHSTIGRSYRLEPSDVLQTKKALRQIGYYHTPSYGITEISDDPMFNGIERFQQDNRLRKDGIIRPCGETQNAINYALTRQELASQQGLRSGPLFGMYDRFASQLFHMPGGAMSTTCCATGTIDCEND